MFSLSSLITFTSLLIAVGPIRSIYLFIMLASQNNYKDLRISTFHYISSCVNIFYDVFFVIDYQWFYCKSWFVPCSVLNELLFTILDSLLHRKLMQCFDKLSAVIEE